MAALWRGNQLLTFLKAHHVDSGETGAAIIPLVRYTLFGSSRQLILGPDAATCIMVAASLRPAGARRPPAVSRAPAGADADHRRALPRGRARPPRLLRELALAADLDRLPQRDRHRHHRRPAAQAAGIPQRGGRGAAPAARARSAAGQFHVPTAPLELALRFRVGYCPDKVCALWNGEADWLQSLPRWARKPY